MCHQLAGEGGKVGPDLTVEGTRGRFSEWLIGYFKDPPAYIPGSIKPPFKNLTASNFKRSQHSCRARTGARCLVSSPG